MNQAIFNTAPQDAKRYAGLMQAYDVHTIAHLEATGIGTGGHCLEVGAGGGSIAHWMAQRVGPSGHVVATEIDPLFLAALEAQNLPNLEARRHDIGTDSLPEQSFDLIHARLVLLHVPNRRQALARLVAALKPGGWIVIEDFDPIFIEDRGFATQDATDKAFFQKMVTRLPTALEARGHETGWARNLYRRFREHGLHNVGLEGRFTVARGSSPAAETMSVIFKNMRAAMVTTGLATEQEVDTFLQLLKNPEFAFTTPIMMSAWGQRV
jgi:ubiquinone/menaquinone biosynthesis C-methylase UbiE